MKKGDFILSSGRKSELYFDMKGLMLNPIVIGDLVNEFHTMLESDIGHLMYNLIGMELGGAQLVQVMVGSGFEGMIVRKQQKNYGLKDRLITTGVISNDHLVIVDDVITSGNTIKEIEKLFAPTVYKILGTYCIIDRTEDGRYKSLFKEKDFLK